jgi:hypothetical protein
MKKIQIYKNNLLGECFNEQHTNGNNILFDILVKKCRNIGNPISTV